MSPPHPLEGLSRPGGSLKPEPPDGIEIAGLLRTGRARLMDAGNTTLALGLGPDVWRVLDLCHNRRNLGEYEGLLEVDERLITDLIAAVHRVNAAL